MNQPINQPGSRRSTGSRDVRVLASVRFLPHHPCAKKRGCTFSDLTRGAQFSYLKKGETRRENVFRLFVLSIINTTVYRSRLICLRNASSANPSLTPARVGHSAELLEREDEVCGRRWGQRRPGPVPLSHNFIQRVS